MDRSRLLLLGAALALLLIGSGEARAYSCIDGQTCLCDCYANTDGTSNDTGSGAYANSTCQARGIPKRTVLLCEDFENAELNDGDTSFGTDAYGTIWGDGWDTLYGPGEISDACNDQSKPTGQGRRNDGAEGTHSFSCLNVVQEGACEGVASDCVYDGTSTLMHRFRNRQTGGIAGRKSWTTQSTFGITLVMKWSSNFLSPHDPGSNGPGNKTNEFGNADNCILGCSTTNAGAGSGDTPLAGGMKQFSSNPGASASVSVGAVEWLDTGYRYAPAPAWQLVKDNWYCIQWEVDNWATAGSGRIRYRIADLSATTTPTTYVDVSGLDLTKHTLDPNGIGRMTWNSYYNGPPPPGQTSGDDGYQGSTLAGRFEDNLVISSGDPVPCAEVAAGSSGASISILSVTPSNATPATATAINLSTAFTATGTTGTIYADVDCENDGGWEDGTQSGTSPITNSGVCSYATAGSKTIGVRVRDSGSTVATSSTTISVGSSVTITSVTLDDATPDQSTPVDVTVAFSNVNGVANYTAAVDCENDGGYEDGSQAGASSPITVSNVCSYSSSGAQTIGVRVTDAGTASDTDTAALVVNQPSGGGGSCSTPTIDASATGTQASSATVQAALTGVDADAFLVCTLANADDSSFRKDWTVTSSPALTWTRRTNAEASGSGNAEIWTSSAFAAGGSITVTGTLTSATAQSIACYAITGGETPGGGATSTETGEMAPSTAITTTQDNSLIIGVVSDYDAVAGGSTPTYRSPPTHTETLKHNLPGTTYNAWHFRAPATTAGSYTMGISAPTGQSSGATYLEVRCTETAPGAPSLSNVVITPSDATPAYGATWTASVAFSASSTTTPYTVLIDCDADGYDDGVAVGNSSPIDVAGVCAYYTAGVATVTAQVSDTGPTATAEGSTTVTVDAPTLTISSLSLSPNTGTPPTNDVDVTVTVGGTATGSVGLLVDCTSDGTYDGGAYCASSPCTATDVCDFQSVGTFTTYATAARSNVFSSATATATISSPVSLAIDSVTPSASGAPAPILGIDLLFLISGSATGSVLLEADCDNGAGYEVSATDSAEPFLLSDACTFQYAGTYMIPVRVTRDGLQSSGTLVVLVTEDAGPSTVFFSPNRPAGAGWMPSSF